MQQLVYRFLVCNNIYCDVISYYLDHLHIVQFRWQRGGETINNARELMERNAPLVDGFE